MHNMFFPYGINILEKGMVSVIPETVIIIFAFLVLSLTFFDKLAKKENPYYLSLIGIVFSIIYTIMLSGRNIEGFYGSVVFNEFEVFLFIAILLTGLFTVLISKEYVKNSRMPSPEYYSLILFGLSGMMFLVSSNNLIMVFLSIEFMSICAYILTGYIKGSTRSTEAALKYFILGAFSSAFLLFGAVFIYASVGHINLNSIHSFLQNISYSNFIGQNGGIGIKLYLSIGLLLFLVGLAFKMSLFPFHSWTPDAYDGAPTPITSFMATGIKISAFAIFLRIYMLIYNFNIMNFNDVLWLIAVLSMTFGNIAALLSSNIKRLFAYSSIAQAGYILVGIIGGGIYGYSGTLFYLLSYVFMTTGAFALVIIFENSDLNSLDIKRYTGIGYKYPLLAAGFSFILLSLAGIPMTSGFMAKFYVFSSAVKSGYNWLVVIALLNSAFAAFYYFKIIVKMYMPEKEPSNLSEICVYKNNNNLENGRGLFDDGLIFTIAICLILTLFMGILPQVFINFTHNSVASLWGM